MDVNIRIKLTETGKKITIPVNLPYHIGLSKDKLDDAVSDWLDENGVKYRWFRVLSEKE